MFKIKDSAIKILIYIPRLNQKSGGIRQYAYNIIKNLSEIQNGKYSIYIYNLDDDSYLLNLIKDSQISIIKENKIDIIKSFSARLFFKLFNKRCKSFTRFDFFLKRNNIDIVHCPYQFIPKTTNAKLITTIHDVQEIHFPEFFSPQQRAQRAVNYYDYMQRSNVIIVSYSHVKNDLIKYFNIDESKIYVLTFGLKYLWLCNFSKEIQDHSFHEKYLFYPANSWHHKNHLILIQALDVLRSMSKKVFLIFTGDFENSYGVYLKNKIHDLKLDDQIIIKGVVSHDELFIIYSNATGIIIPTLYEAGSFPLYESIFLEKAVICSNVTSLPDTIEDSQFVFNPYDIESVVYKMEKLYYDEEFRINSIHNSIRIKNKMTNISIENKLHEVYFNIK